MRILIASDTYYPHVNGCSYASQRLAYYLALRGHTVSVIAPARSIADEQYHKDCITIYGIKSIPLPIYPNKFRLPIPIILKRKIKNILLKTKPEIIHIQTHYLIGRSALSEAKKLGIPVVATNHMMAENFTRIFHFPKTAEKIACKILYQDLVRVLDRADVVTVPTDTAALILKDTGFKKKILTISNGIDLNKFHQQKGTVDLRKKYHLVDKPTILYLGRLDKEKNVDFLIKAFYLANTGNLFQFLIAGRGLEEKRLKKLTHKLHLDMAVHFLGFIPDQDLASLYSLADCFVIASSIELQSLVTMEAMAYGLPVVAAKTTALPELVKHGQNGFLFNLTRKKACADSITKILTNESLRWKMSRESLKIIKNHDINLSLQKLEAIYQKLARRPIKTNSESSSNWLKDKLRPIKKISAVIREGLA